MSHTETAPASLLTGHAVALALVAAATGAAVLLDRSADISDLSLVFVLPVVVAAAVYGWGAAVTAVVAGLLSCNFFLIEPRYSLRVAEASNLWGLALLLAVAAIVSAVAARSRQKALEADRHSRQATSLQSLSRALNGASRRDIMADQAVRTLADLFGAPAMVLAERPAGLELLCAHGQSPVSAADLEAAGWSAASRLATRAGMYPVEEATYDFWPFAAPTGAVVLGVALSTLDERPAAPQMLIDVIGGQLATALEREHFAAQALQSGIDRESERLKGDLLAAVSHDLRTPLASILVSLQSLRRFGEGHDAPARDALLAVAESETARLAGMVANLLDMSRLDCGAVAVHAREMRAADLVDAALARVPTLQGRDVRCSGGEEMRLFADPALAEAALGNLIENAAKYSPSSEPIAIRIRREEDLGMIEVLDRGEGFGGPSEPLFSRFARGVEGDGRPPGTGLGLAIARGFAEAMGGRVEAEDRQDGPGAAVRLILPLATRPL